MKLLKMEELFQYNFDFINCSQSEITVELLKIAVESAD